MDLGMRGRLAVVTGASSGMGKATALSLLKEGAKVLIASRSEDKLRIAAEELSKEGEIYFQVADVTKTEDIEGLYKRAEELGGADILVVSYGGPRIARFSELEDRDWYDSFNLLVMSSVRLSKLFGYRMKERGWGRIAFITSTAIREVNMSIPLSSVVRVSLTGLIKVLSRELAPEVTVNGVMPGMIITERQRELLTVKAREKGISLEQMEAEASAEVPARRFGRPEEIGDLIAFLCSEKASYISGALVPVDGGYLAYI
ncbi:MAG: SDR family oxidoreductase [Candidatus Korarchaeum sp.]|nr:SDR family oxidoreductase [Candidatus Korarchaeum sp.]MDW8035118.1 SDR family oxidoreductase [Candidatus Korarchaeum sp.]